MGQMSGMIKALLIDDDQKLGDLLKNYLKTFDIDLSVVNDPREGITTIRGLAVSYTHLTLPTKA